MSETDAKKPTGFWESKRRIAFWTKIFVVIVLSFGALSMLFPILWMVATSLKDPIAVSAKPDSFTEWVQYWFPYPFQFENYPNAWNIGGMYASEGITFTTYTVNTLIIAISSCIGVAFSSSLVAFAFARLRFPGRGPLFILCLATMMVPPQVTMIPTYIFFRTIQWTDTFLPLIVPAFLGGGAYNIFLMRQFFMTIPYEMDEAAKIDGCTNFEVFWRILLPLCKPALATITVFAFVYNWNDFLNPLIYLDSNSKKTLALGLTNFISLYGQQYHLLMAAALIMVIPIVVIFLFGQRFFIQGIATTGLK